MKVIILKAFPYAHDGFTIHDLKPSDQDPPELVEIRDSLVAGLSAAGYIFTGQGAPLAIQQPAPEAQAAADDVRAGAAEVVAEAVVEHPVEEQRPALTDLFDVHYRNPTSGAQLIEKSLTRDAAEALATKLAAMDEPPADIRIEPAYAEAPQPITDIPADWSTMHWKQRVALAKLLGWVDGEPTKEQADGWIADVLTQRERAQLREDLGGLSLQEVHATLTAAGVEWEADTSPADLLSLYELAQAEKAGK